MLPSEVEEERALYVSAGVASIKKAVDGISWLEKGAFLVEQYCSTMDLNPKPSSL
jgi:hypothetical protein